MKRLLSLLLVLVFSLALFAGCSTPQEATSDAATEGDVGGVELALITDVGTIDDKSFNQGTWEGLVQYAEENDIAHQYYQPTEASTDAYLASMELAVQNGAKVIVTPGFLFEVPIYLAQDIYTDVTFILIDGYPHSEDYSDFKTNENAVGIKFVDAQSGFLAGYAAVKDGNTKLGFLGGMAVPAVVGFGYGFVQGAEYAAQEMGLAEGSIEMKYAYTGAFEASQEAQTQAASWYNGGTEVIFACGGALGNSVMAAAEQEGGKVIGVDVDQSFESETVITSAMKGLGVATYDMLSAYYNGEFPGGESLVFDASNMGVQLPMETSRFDSFAQADYDALYEMLANDTDGIASGIIGPLEGENDGMVTTAEIPLSAIVMDEVK